MDAGRSVQKSCAQCGCDLPGTGEEARCKVIDDKAKAIVWLRVFGDRPMVTAVLAEGYESTPPCFITREQIPEGSPMPEPWEDLTAALKLGWRIAASSTTEGGDTIVLERSMQYPFAPNVA